MEKILMKNLESYMSCLIFASTLDIIYKTSSLYKLTNEAVVVVFVVVVVVVVVVS